MNGVIWDSDDIRIFGGHFHLIAGSTVDNEFPIKRFFAKCNVGRRGGAPKGTEWLHRITFYVLRESILITMSVDVDACIRIPCARLASNYQFSQCTAANAIISLRLKRTEQMYDAAFVFTSS